MVRWLMLALTGWVLFISGCGTENAGQVSMSTTSPMEAKYDFFSGEIPFPNNLLFLGTANGKLNSRVSLPIDFQNPNVALNSLDGFSTVAPLTASFSSAIDPATLTPASVRLFEVTHAGLAKDFAVTGIVSELSFGVQFKVNVLTSDPKTLEIIPALPLKSNKCYLVVITNALKSISGDIAKPSIFFSLIKNTSTFVSNGLSQLPGYADSQAQQLENLRLTAQGMFETIEAIPPAISRQNVVSAWTFKTQTMNKVLTKIQVDSLTDPYATNLANFITSAAPPIVYGDIGVLDFYSYMVAESTAGNPFLMDAYTASPALYDTIGSIVIGALKLPYYLQGAYANPQDPLTGSFQLDTYGAAVTQSIQTVPFLLTIPGGVAPVSLGNKWPVVIFQHDFGSDKSDLFGVANTLAKSGFAVIAIDAVLHGDRTFNLDVVDNASGAVAADTFFDASGTHYFNLESLITSRDNVQQTVADLIHLTRLLEVQTIDVVNNTSGLPTGFGDGPDLVVSATTPVSFVGHGNGGALGIMLAAVEPAVKTFALANTGGGYAKILQASGVFDTVISRGLDAQGIASNSLEAHQFLVKAQTIFDDAEPLNYARQAIATGKSILMLKTLNDTNVINNQTDALLLGLGLRQVAFDPSVSSWSLGVVASPLVGSGFTVFTQGSHDSFLKPNPTGLVGNDVLFEMQTEAALFLVNGVVGSATIAVGANPLPSANLTSTVVQ